MGKNKDIRKQISSLQKRVREHDEAIRQEMTKSIPDFGYINHWRHEIEAWEQRIRKLEYRLGRDW